MSAKMTPEAATALRRPFPKESIGRLPKGGAMLDFVGHAAVTDRLLSIDPEWTWDFAEVNPDTGQPSLRFSLDPEKNLWIRLTICGVTRIGVGDGPSMKEKIGDAIRNAAMRFGVALDLWAKENLVEFAHAAKPVANPAPQPEFPPAHDLLLDTHSKLAKALYAGLRAAENAGVVADPKAYLSEVVGRPIASSKELTEDEARRVLGQLPTLETGAAS